MSLTASMEAKTLATRLGALVAITPFAIDTYLPAMPSIASQLSSQVNAISMTVPLFLVGFGLGQLIGGPLSDRFGRKPIALLGLLVFMVSSLLIVFSINIEQLYVMRIIQALGGGFATVVSAAMVRDLTSGKASAEVFSMIALVMLVAPLVAPGVGALILSVSEWHSIFLFLAGYAVLLFVMVRWTLPETLTATKQQQARAQPLADLLLNYLQVFKNKPALGFLLAQGFASSALFVYVTESPFIYMEVFHVSSSDFPFYFGVVVLGVMFFNRMNIGLLKRYEPRQILLGVLSLQALMAMLMVAYIALFSPNVYVVLLLQFFIIGLLGAVTPNSQACYLDYFGHMAGTANALMGSSIFAMGGMMGLLIGFLHNDQLITVAGFVLGLSLISITFLILMAKVHIRN